MMSGWGEKVPYKKTIQKNQLNILYEQKTGLMF